MIKHNKKMLCIFAGVLGLYHLQAWSIDTNDQLLSRLLQRDSNDHTILTRHLWRPIQENSRDTVVQVFAQIAEQDLFQPYKTPAQYGARGSGFFINEQGDILTNAHVIDQAVAIWIQIPSLGRRLIDVTLIGLCPERDVALLRITDQHKASIEQVLGRIPFLLLGNSDTVSRADEVLALGYPLGQESLKSTTGVISGRERNLIQMSAAINPGSSGGPLLNTQGEVIGINTSGFSDAQNIGYIIPINDVLILLPDLSEGELLRKPSLGLLYHNSTDALTEFLGAPQPGGYRIAEVLHGSPAEKAGILPGDLVYAINNYQVDIYGEIRVPWGEDKISINNYIASLPRDTHIKIVTYRAQTRLEYDLVLNDVVVQPVRRIYPGYESLDYEVFGGMVVMELTINHVKMLKEQVPGLARYTDIKQSTPVLIITHIFSNSQLFKSRTVWPGYVINAINGRDVATLTDFRQALMLSKQTNYLTIEAIDTVNRTSDHIFVVLPFAQIAAEEPLLAQTFRYPLTKTVQTLLEMDV